MDGSGGITGLSQIISGVSSTQQVVQAKNNTTALQQFASNTILRGVVTARGINNSVTIKTDQGNIMIQTEVFLRRGAEVTLKVEHHGKEALARIVTVNGQSLGKYLESGQTTAQQQTQDKIAPSSNMMNGATAQSAEAGATNKPANLANQPIIYRGVFLSPPELPANISSQLPANVQQSLAQVTAGTSLQVEIRTIQVPNAAGSGMQSLNSTIESVITPQSSATSQGFATTQASGYALSPAQRIAATSPQIQTALANQEAAQATISQSANMSGNVDTTIHANKQTPVTAQLQAQISTDAAPTHKALTDLPPLATSGSKAATAAPSSTSSTNTTPSSTATAQPASQAPQNAIIRQEGGLTIFQAVVANNANPRELTMQSPLGTFKLFVHTTLPKGSIIELSLQNVANVRSTSLTPQNISQLQDFEALASLQALQQQSIPTTQLSPPDILPKPGAQLSSEMLFLMSALKGGDFKKWIGEANLRHIETLGKPELLAKVTQEFGQLNAPPSEARDGNWHQFTLPIFSEERVQPIRFFTKGQKHKTQTPDQDRTSDHFMVDLELTRMGRMQLDGLIQKEQRNTQFDLIIRTEKSWEPSIENDIRSIFIRAQEISGFNGSINFRQGRDALTQLPVDIDAQAPSNNHSIIA